MATGTERGIGGEGNDPAAAAEAKSAATEGAREGIEEEEAEDALSGG